MNAPTAAVSEAFCELVRTYNACMQKTLSKYGLYPGQPQVLFAISKLGSPTRSARISSRMRSSLG